MNSSASLSRPGRRAPPLGQLLGLLTTLTALTLPMGPVAAAQQVRTIERPPVAEQAPDSQWSFQRTGSATAGLSMERTREGRAALHVSSDRRSTGWVQSAPMRAELPYTVSFWVWVSPERYNGFTVYDAVDASNARTDIRLFFHDDRTDRSRQGDWRGFVWVRDAQAQYSIADLPRGDWAKVSIIRHSARVVELSLNDAPVGRFASRSAAPLSTIGPIGDVNDQWWHGEAYWSGLGLSAPRLPTTGREPPPPPVAGGQQPPPPPPPVDLYVTQQEITFDPVSPTENRSVVVQARVHNTGAERMVPEVVVVISETGEALFQGQVAVPPTGHADVQIPWTPAASGSYTIFVSVNPFQSLAEDDYANNGASRAVTVAADATGAGTGGIEHAAADISFQPATASPGASVTITARVRNTGSTDENVNVFFRYSRPGTSQQTIGFTQSLVVPAGGSISPSVALTVPQQQADAIQIHTEVRSSGAVVAQATTPLPAGMPNLGLTPDDVIFTSGTWDTQPVTIQVTVHNHGIRAESIWVEVTRPGVSGAVGRTLVNVPAAGTATASLTGPALMPGEYTFRAELTARYGGGATALSESSYDDNVATKTLRVIDAWDPSVVDLRVTPEKPSENATLDIRVWFANRGGGRAVFDAELVALMGDGRERSIGSYTIGPLVTGPPVTNELQATFTALRGLEQIVARVDPHNSLDEGDESNNVLAKDVSTTYSAAKLLRRGQEEYDDDEDEAGNTNQIKDYETNDQHRVWTYATADGLNFRLHDTMYSAQKIVPYAVFEVDTLPGATCRGDLHVTVSYAGVIDRVGMVSPLGGMAGGYLARVFVGYRPEREYGVDDVKIENLWVERTDAFSDAVLEITKVILGATISAGIGLLGPGYGPAADIGSQVLLQAADVTSCDAEVNRRQKISWYRREFTGGEEYRVLLGIQTIAKAVAVAVGTGYAEVDFYNRSPANCDDDGKDIPHRGIKIESIELICR